jgi:photosystem I subunit 9
MQDAKTYLSTPPVLATLWFGFLAGLLIRINHFFSRCSYSSILFKSTYIKFVQLCPVQFLLASRSWAHINMNLLIY